MSRSLDACASALRRRFGEDVLCDVVSVEGDDAALWPAERELVAAAVPARRREFAAGRACARRLLGELGFEPAALLRSGDRAPLWPAGATGSIAHDRRLCAVAVARGDRVAALGIDVEPDEPLEADLWPELFVANELKALGSCPRHARGNVARTLFSAKECVYKATHALVRESLGFRDVEIRLAPGGRRFRARVLGDGVLEGFQLACAGSILTGILVLGGSFP